MEERKKINVFLKSSLILGMLIFGFFIHLHNVSAASVSWTKNGSGTWETGANWSTGSVPTSADDVTINSPTGTLVTVTLSSGQTANFSTLAIGGGTASSTLVLTGNIGTGGSMTINSNGKFQQSNSSTQSITGTLTVSSGGILTHTTNTTAFLYSLDINAQTIDIQSGGLVDVRGRGYQGVAASAGSGPGAGAGGTGVDGSGGGHAGNGGYSNAVQSNSQPGGVGYCDITNISTIGSSGGGGNSTGGAGGGLVRLSATGTLTVSGSIYAQGLTNSSANLTTAAGAGGGVKLVADTITGTPNAFTVVGATPSSGTGGGGGGCIQLVYTTSNSITSGQVSLSGGSSGSGDGGGVGSGGLMYVKQTTATYGDLYSFSNFNQVIQAKTPLIGNYTFNSISATGTLIFVSSTKSLTLSNSNATPFANGSNTRPSTLYVQGSLNIGTDTIDKIAITLDGATFTNSSTLNLTSSGSFSLATSSILSTPLTSVSSSGALTLTASGVAGNVMSGLDLTINASTTVLSGYTSTTQRLNLNSLTLNGGTLTHLANNTARTHSINISANTITIAAGGKIDVDGKGYAPNISPYGNGSGPGGGGGSSFSLTGAGGGAHGGNGGNGGSGGGSGGTAYCTISNVYTLGSAGGNDPTAAINGGAGGGLVILNATSTLTFSGTITARGSTSTASNSGGGGAGGGVKLTARTITGTPSLFSVQGGKGQVRGGGGGGGCVQILYTTSNSITTSTVIGGLNGGTSSPGDGAGGLFSASNTLYPTSTSFTPSQISSTTVRFSTIISDIFNRVSSLLVQYSTDGSTWSSATLGNVTSSVGTVTTTSGRVGSIDTDVSSTLALTIPWLASTDLLGTDDTTVFIRIIPSDGTTNAATNTSASFALDTKPPTTPGNLTVYSPTTTAVRLTFPSTTSTDTNFLEYRIYYGTTSPISTSSLAFTSSSDSNLTNSNFNAATSTNVTGLSLNTTYYFKLYVFDTWMNTSSSIAEVSTTTLVNAPGAPTLGTPTPSTIPITINTNSNPTSTEYAIYNETSGNYLAANGSSNGSTPIWQTTTTWGNNFAATGLTVNTTYQFSTIARNSANIQTTTSSFSSAMTSGVNNPPTTPSTSNITSSSIQFTWVSGSGNETYFILDKSIDGTTFNTLATTTTSTVTYTFSGLSINTRYWFRVAAADGINTTSSYITSTPVYTLAATPSIPSSVTSTATSTLTTTVDSTTLNGNHSTNTTFIVLDTGSGSNQYLQSDHTWGSATATLTYAQLGSGSATTTTGLTANTPHAISVAAVNGDSTVTSYGSSVSSYTLASTPTSLSATPNSDTQITLSWSGDATEYYAENTTASTNSGWQVATSYAFTGLTCNTSYTFQVKGRNGDSTETSFSSTTQATTNSCATDGGGSSGGGSTGSGFGSSIPPIIPVPIPTSTIPNDPINGGLVFPDDFYFFPWQRPGAEGSTTAPSLGGLVVPEDETSEVILTKLPKTPVTQGADLTYTYSYKNTNPQKQTITIMRDIIRLKDNRTIFSTKALKTLNTKQTFTFSPHNPLTPNTLYTPGIYRTRVRVFNSTGKLLKAQNGFKFEIIPAPPAKVLFSKLPTIPLKQNQVLTYTYSYKNITNKTQTYQLLREVIQEDTNQPIITSKGTRTVKPNQSLAVTPKDKITSPPFTSGSYIIRITVFDAQGKEVKSREEVRVVVVEY